MKSNFEFSITINYRMLVAKPRLGLKQWQVRHSVSQLVRVQRLIRAWHLTAWIFNMPWLMKISTLKHINHINTFGWYCSLDCSTWPEKMVTIVTKKRPGKAAEYWNVSRYETMWLYDCMMIETSCGAWEQQDLVLIMTCRLSPLRCSIGKLSWDIIGLTDSNYYSELPAGPD